MKRFIVTGATGHIGVFVIQALIKNNENVTCLVLPRDNSDYLKSLGCQIIEGDVRNKELLNNLIEIDDVVIHLAGIISISKKNENLVYDVNYQGTKNIADACMKAGARLIYTSSVHVLKALKQGKINEEVGFNIKSHRGPYEESKSLATNYVFECFKKGLKGLVLYPSAIIGPQDTFVGEVSNALIMLYKKKMPAYIKGGYSFVDVRDVANGIISAAYSEINAKGYILSNEYISIKNLMKLVYTHYGYKHMPPYCPLFLVYIGLPFIALWAKIRNKTPIFTRIMLKTVLSNGDFDNSNAKKDLQFKVRPLEESIVDSIEWLKDEHKELF